MKSLKKIGDFDAMIEAQCEMAEDLVVWIGKLQAINTEQPGSIADAVKVYLIKFIETWGQSSKSI